MFGYIRPLVSEMRVRENEMFRAVYCGLCRAMGKHTGCASRLTLSYDFVFLALLRAALTGEKFTVGQHRCAVHPLRPRAMAEDSPALAYCAAAAACLTHAKLEDDIRDERGMRRVAAYSLRPAAASMRRRTRHLDGLSEKIAVRLDKLSALEGENTASIDRPAAVFGDLLGDVFAESLSGTESRIARAVGESVGRFIYVIDAADDAADDAAHGRYNPILALYGTDILTTRSAPDRRGKERERTCLALPVAEDIYRAALLSLSSLESALDLIDFRTCQAETAEILRNTAYLGMPSELSRVLALPYNSFPKGCPAGQSEP